MPKDKFNKKNGASGMASVNVTNGALSPFVGQGSGKRMVNGMPWVGPMAPGYYGLPMPGQPQPQPATQPGAFYGIPMTAVGQGYQIPIGQQQGQQGSPYGAPGATPSAYEGVNTSIGPEEWQAMWGSDRGRGYGLSYENWKNAQAGNFYGLNSYGQPLGTQAPYNKRFGKGGNNNAFVVRNPPKWLLNYVKENGYYQSPTKVDSAGNLNPTKNPPRIPPGLGITPYTGTNQGGNGNGGNNSGSGSSGQQQYYYPSDLLNWRI